jgi:hypothetical protein
MTRIVIPFKDLPLLFVQITGQNGKKRELLAAIDPVSQDVVVPRLDLFHWGYDAYADQPGQREEVKERFPVRLGLAVGSIIEAIEWQLPEIRIGPLAVKNVKAIGYDIPHQTGVDIMLGASFLSRLKTTIDFEKRQITLEDFPAPPEEEVQ